MQHTPPVTEQMQRLLEPVSPLWIAERLGVTPQTVNHWKRGRHVSERRLQEAADAIRQLLPEHEEAAPPDWAERLERRLDVLVSRAGVDPSRLDEDETTRLVREALARASSPQRNAGGA